MCDDVTFGSSFGDGGPCSILWECHETCINYMTLCEQIIHGTLDSLCLFYHFIFMWLMFLSYNIYSSFCILGSIATVLSWVFILDFVLLCRTHEKENSKIVDQPLFFWGPSTCIFWANSVWIPSCLLSHIAFSSLGRSCFPPIYIVISSLTDTLFGNALLHFQIIGNFVFIFLPLMCSLISLRAESVCHKTQSLDFSCIAADLYNQAGVQSVFKRKCTVRFCFYQSDHVY